LAARPVRHEALFAGECAIATDGTDASREVGELGCRT
jgi:hypothetical protein